MFPFPEITMWLLETAENCGLKKDGENSLNRNNNNFDMFCERKS